MGIGPNEIDGAFAARLLASISQPVVVVDTDFRVVYFNSSAEETLGWTAGEMLGEDIVSAAGINLTDSRADELLRSLGGGENVVEDFNVTRRDGTRIPVLVNLTPLYGESGEFVGMVAIATDITERTAIEQANRRLSSIVSSSSDGIIGFDLTGTVTSWNAAATQLFGYPEADMLGAKLDGSRSGSRWNGPFWPALIEALPTTGTVSFEGEYTSLAGPTIHMECAMQPVRDRLGNVIGGAVICRDATARHALERAAAHDHAMLEEAQQIAGVGSFEFDLEHGVLTWSRELKRVTGVGEDPELTLDEYVEHVHADDRKRFREEVIDQLLGGGSSFDVRYRFVRPDGETRSLHTLGRANRDPSSDRILNVVGSTQDVTDRERQEEARRLAEQQFTAAFELGNVGMVILGIDRRIRRVNPTFCRMLGRTAEEIIGCSPDEFSHPEDLRAPSASLTEELLATGRPNIEMEWRYLRPDGDVVHTIVHLAMVKDPEGNALYTFAQVVDITDRKRAERELERLAMQDPLTGLPNRNLLQDRLGNALGRAKRGQHKIAVLFVDIDHFKLVNDSLGHSAGDDLLRQVAHRLELCTRAGDTTARFGGDEFVLVCEDVHDAAEAIFIGERVIGVCEEAFRIDEQQLYVSLSVGIVVATPQDTPATLLRDADTAMYRAKELGRSRCELFDSDLRYRTTRRLDIELALRRALEHDEFRIEYQPILAFPDDIPVATEALIRWDHPERGVVPPSEFIRAAEETGLIVPIGEWVIDKAVEQTVTWRREIPAAASLAVCVNLSPRQLTTGVLVDRTLGTLARHGLDPSVLCLEITETAAMEDADVSVPILRSVADAGIHLAVDDFGAGYSSLSRLKRLPVQILKIDRSFVDGLGAIGQESDDLSIVRAIVSLGNALNLQLCAEGVETEEQRAVLAALGCHTGQGYLWSKPLRAEEFESWLTSITPR